MREVEEGREGICWFSKFLSTPRPRLWREGEGWKEKKLACLYHLSRIGVFRGPFPGPFLPQTHPHIPALSWGGCCCGVR